MAKSIAKKIMGKESKNILKDVEKFQEMQISSWSNDIEFDDPFPGLSQAIYDQFASGDVGHIQKKTFAPSTITFGNGKCPRFWYIAFDGSDDWDNRTSGISQTKMDAGTWRHKKIQDAMTDAGIMIESEGKIFNSDPPIFGYMDGLINWEDSDYVLEIKTVGNDAFNRIKKSMKPSSYHVLQTLMYMKILKKKNGMLMYENRDTFEIISLPINVTQRHVDFTDYLFDWMREVHQAWKDRKLPEVPYKNNNVKVPCGSCPVQKTCQSLPKGDIKIARRKEEKGEF